jgi:hypothetical protein
LKPATVLLAPWTCGGEAAKFWNPGMAIFKRARCSGPKTFVEVPFDVWLV